MSDYVDVRGIRIPITADDRTNAALQQLKAKLEGTSKVGADAFRGIQRNSETANQAARILTNTIGIQLPEALSAAMAKSKALGPILAGAFGVGVAVGFVAVIREVPDIIKKGTDALAGWTDSAKSFYDQMVKGNQQLLLSFDSVAQGMAVIAQANQQITALQNEKDALSKAKNYGFDPYLAIPGVGGAKVLWDMYSGRKRINELDEKERQQQELLWNAHKKLQDVLKQSQKVAEERGKSSVASLDKEASQVQKLMTQYESLMATVRGETNKDLDPTAKHIADIDALIAEIQKYKQETQAAGVIDVTLNEELRRLGEQRLSLLRQQNAEYASLAAFISRSDQKRISDILQANTSTVPVFVPDQKSLNGMRAFEERLKTWNTITDGVSHSFDTMFNDIALGTRGIGQAFQSMGASIVASLGQVVAKMTAMMFVQRAMMSLFGAIFPAPSMPTHGAGLNPYGTTGMVQPLPPPIPHATGGPVLPNYPIRVGERGPEVWWPSQSGAIIPNAGTSPSQPNVSVQVINSGTEKNARTTQPRYDQNAKKWIIGVVLEDMNNNGPIRQALGTR